MSDVFLAGLLIGFPAGFITAVACMIWYMHTKIVADPRIDRYD